MDEIFLNAEIIEQGYGLTCTQFLIKCMGGIQTEGEGGKGGLGGAVGRIPDINELCDPREPQEMPDFQGKGGMSYVCIVYHVHSRARNAPGSGEAGRAVCSGPQIHEGIQERNVELEKALSGMVKGPPKRGLYEVWEI